MNQKMHTIRLRGHLQLGEGWGRAAGALAASKLRGNIDAQRDVALFRISLGSIRKLDVNFAAEALVGVIAAYRTRTPICLVDVEDPDVRANVAAAAVRESVPVTAWVNLAVAILGPSPSGAQAQVLALALARHNLRAKDVASVLAISLSNASTRLKDLHDTGYLRRTPVVAPSGGSEFIYSPLGAAVSLPARARG